MGSTPHLIRLRRERDAPPIAGLGGLLQLTKMGARTHSWSGSESAGFCRTLDVED